MAGEKILIADDEPTIRALLNAALEPLGYEVIHAADGLDALNLTREHDISVVVADVNMPGLDGIELTEKLRRMPETYYLPVVIITGAGDREYKIRALNAGATDFLHKPISPPELQARVRWLCKVKLYHDLLRDSARELEERVRARTKELDDALSTVREYAADAVLRLARAAEFRDDDTGRHINRIVSYVELICDRIGTDEHFVETIRHAAPLHDIGKIAVPDAILLKPAALDEEEWRIMKTHTTAGESILAGSKSEYLRLAARIARSHHEKWDGSGYPNGFQAAEIPLSGRIVAVADVFDALTSKRVYKKAFPLDKAFSIISEDAGSHFDPEIAAAFLSAKPDVSNIYRELADHPV